VRKNKPLATSDIERKIKKNSRKVTIGPPCPFGARSHRQNRTNQMIPSQKAVQLVPCIRNIDAVHSHGAAEATGC
jgi:hypothetical protein